MEPNIEDEVDCDVDEGIQCRGIGVVEPSDVVELHHHEM